VRRGSSVRGLGREDVVGRRDPRRGGRPSGTGGRGRLVNERIHRGESNRPPPSAKKIGGGPRRAGRRLRRPVARRFFLAAEAGRFDSPEGRGSITWRTTLTGTRPTPPGSRPTTGRRTDRCSGKSAVATRRPPGSFIGGTPTASA